MKGDMWKVAVAAPWKGQAVYYISERSARRTLDRAAERMARDYPGPWRLELHLVRGGEATLLDSRSGGKAQKGGVRHEG